MTTLGINIIGKELVFSREHTARYLIGSGKAEELMKQANVDGLLVGGASLDPESFAKIVQFEERMN